MKLYHPLSLHFKLLQHGWKHLYTVPAGIMQFTHIVAVNISIRQHHGRVVFIHDLSRDFTDQSGIGAVGHGQRLSQLVKRFTAHWAVWVFRGAILLVALTGLEMGVKD